MKIKRKKFIITITQITYFLIICVAILRATQFHVMRTDNMDLARHFHMMDLIKKSGYSLFEYVFVYGDTFTSNISMKFCYSFNFIVYTVAKYIENYYIMAWRFVLVSYSIIAYIGVDWWRNRGVRISIMVIFEILICFSLLPFFQVVSGLRTALSASVTALAIYLYLYKNRSLSTFIIVSVIAATFHPAFITAIPFVFLTKFTDRRKGLAIAIVGSAMIPLTANILIRLPNRFLYSIAFKYLQYTGGEGYTSTRFCYYGVIVICILVILQYVNTYIPIKISRIVKQYKYPQKEEIKVYDFTLYYMLFILSNIGKYEMVLRPAYLLGAMAPIITGMIFEAQRDFRKSNTFSTIILLMIFIVISYVSVKYLFWHEEYFT